MQFVAGKGPGTYVLNSVLSQYFVNLNVPNSTLTLSSGPYPTRSFTQGNMVPGLVMTPSSTVNSLRCALASDAQGSDIGPVTISLQAESGYTGSSVVQLQGGFNRYSNAIVDWVNVGYQTSVVNYATGVLTINSSTANFPVSGNITVVTSAGSLIISYTSTTATTFTGCTLFAGVALSNIAANNIVTSASSTINTVGSTVVMQVNADQMFPVYRLQSVSTTGTSGIIDWTISNMFPDLSAEGVGLNATTVNTGLGQPAILVNSTIPYGRESNWTGNAIASGVYNVVSTSGSGTAQTYVTNSSASSQPFAVGMLVRVTGAPIIPGTPSYNLMYFTPITAVGGSSGSWQFSTAGAITSASTTAVATTYTLPSGYNQVDIQAMTEGGGLV